MSILKIMRDPYQTSSYSSLELYWIACLLCKTNHSLLFLIFLILVILFLIVDPCTLPMYLGVPFLISIKLITYQKKIIFLTN